MFDLVYRSTLGTALVFLDVVFFLDCISATLSASSFFDASYSSSLWYCSWDFLDSSWYFIFFWLSSYLHIFPIKPEIFPILDCGFSSLTLSNTYFLKIKKEVSGLLGSFSPWTWLVFINSVSKKTILPPNSNPHINTMLIKISMFRMNDKVFFFILQFE